MPFKAKTEQVVCLSYYLIQLGYLMWCGTKLCNGESDMCSAALTNIFCTQAVLFPAAESFYKHDLEVKPPTGAAALLTILSVKWLMNS